MEAVKCIKEKARMCGRDCAISVFTECVGCESWIEQYPEEAVRIIEEWSKAHPRQTNNDKFKEVFGKEPIHILRDIANDYGEWLYAPYEAPNNEK